MSAQAHHGARRGRDPLRSLLLAAMASAAALLAIADAAAAGSGRMATASIGAVNRAAVPGRPAQLPANANAWSWYYGYGGYASGSSATQDDDDADDDDGAAAAAPPPAAPVAAAAPPAAGTVIYALPPGCSTVERNGAYLRSCGGAFYQEQFEGDRVAYLVVNP